MKKRFFAILMTLMMIMTLMPMSAFAVTAKDSPSEDKDTYLEI